MTVVWNVNDHFVWVPQQVFSAWIDVTFKVQRLYGSRHINGVSRQMGGVECQFAFVRTIPVTIDLCWKCADTLCKIKKTSIHIFIITHVSKFKSLSRCQVANKTLWSSLHEKRKKKKWLVNRILKHFIFILLNKIVYWICFPHFERYFVS